MNPLTAVSEVLIGENAALARVDRASHDLRRGNAILIKHGKHRSYLISAESVDDTRLAALNDMSPGQWHLTVTDQRANRLGFEIETGCSSCQVQFNHEPDLAELRRIVDPTANLGEASGLGHAGAGFDCVPGDDLDHAATVLLKHAGLLPAGILIGVDSAESVSADLAQISLVDISEGISAQSHTLKIVSRARVPLEDAEQVELVAFRPSDGSIEHMAIVVGKPDLTQPVLIRLHSECFTGDLLGSLRCDCGSQLRGAISLMASTSGGILLYLAQEGRGIGLINKLRAYQLQDAGQDTVDANLDLGFEEDERDYRPAVEMLKHLNVRQVRVLTNNPRKVDALARLGINVVERVAHVFPANRHNRGYLFTKGTRGGHLFDATDYEQN